MLNLDSVDSERVSPSQITKDAWSEGTFDTQDSKIMSVLRYHTSVWSTVQCGPQYSVVHSTVWLAARGGSSAIDVVNWDWTRTREPLLRERKRCNEIGHENDPDAHDGHR